MGNGPEFKHREEHRVQSAWGSLGRKEAPVAWCGRRAETNTGQTRDIIGWDIKWRDRNTKGSRGERGGRGGLLKEAPVSWTRLVR
jgi:hypothetical protein